MANLHKERSEQGVLSLESLENSSASTHDMSPTTVTLSEEASMITLQESDDDPLILCPVTDPSGIHASSHPHHISSDTTTFTYATFHAGGNIVLKPLKTGQQTQISQTSAIIPEISSSHTSHDEKESDGSHVTGIVGEGVSGDAMAYIYIQGDGDAEDSQSNMDSETPHTITLNSADGSTLHTLPASYTQHLEHTYGDLVLVNSSNDGPSGNDIGRSSNSSTEIHTGEASHAGESVLVFSVQPMKLENRDNLSTLSLPPSSQSNVLPRDSSSTDEMLLEMNTRSQREVIYLEEKLPEEETDTIEARLATRDSLLPPKKQRRAKVYVCPICKAKFKLNYLYNNHLATHKGNDIWHCEICKYSCDTASELKQHKKSMHKDARPYKCSKCELRFQKSQLLEDHVRFVHNKERPLSCTFCNKGFYRPHDLKMHLNLHLGIKSNVCHVCGRQFSHPSNLNRHQRLHTGVKPYVCPTCGKRFFQLILLHKHRATHLPVAGVCPHCPSTFRSAAGLRKHCKLEHKKVMTLHEASLILRGHGETKGRRYYCQVCGDKFLLKCELKKHEQKEHGSGAEILCPSCNKVFTDATAKSHVCISVEEEEKIRLALDEPDDPHVSPKIIPDQLCTIKNETFQGVDKNMKMEEDYLVMYITPEGQSVSYMTKKMEEGNSVLQINAPIGDPLPDDSLQRSVLPEETIMINVHDRPLSNSQQEDSSLISVSAPISSNSPLISSEVDQEDSMPKTDHNKTTSFPDIKLEPLTSDNEVDESHAPEKPPIPTITLNTNASRKSYMRAIAIKRDMKLFIRNETNSEEVKKEKDENVVPVPPLTCKDCGKTFKKRWNFQQHRATHDASLNRYKCEICLLTFAYRSTYTSHLKNHSSEETIYECPICKKTYKKKMSLTQHHRRDHLKIRPYSCEKCEKQFYSKGDYKYHMRLHNKERPYICFACGRGFSHQSHLHRHERTHTDERPHKCPYCAKEFIQLVTLRIHLKKHEKIASREQQSALEAETMYTSTNVDMNFGLERDLPGDPTCQMIGSVEEDGATGGSGLIVIHNSGECDNNIRESLHDATSGDVRLGQSLVGGHPSAESGGLSVDSLTPGAIFHSHSVESDESCTTHQFTGDPSAVVTGMDSECIAIFVQENLNV